MRLGIVECKSGRGKSGLERQRVREIGGERNLSIYMYIHIYAHVVFVCWLQAGKLSSHPTFIFLWSQVRSRKTLMKQVLLKENQMLWPGRPASERDQLIDQTKRALAAQI